MIQEIEWSCIIKLENKDYDLRREHIIEIQCKPPYSRLLAMGPCNWKQNFLVTIINTASIAILSTIHFAPANNQA